MIHWCWMRFSFLYNILSFFFFSVFLNHSVCAYTRFFLTLLVFLFPSFEKKKEKKKYSNEMYQNKCQCLHHWCNKENKKKQTKDQTKEWILIIKKNENDNKMMKKQSILRLHQIVFTFCFYPLVLVFLCFGFVSVIICITLSWDSYVLQNVVCYLNGSGILLSRTAQTNAFYVPKVILSCAEGERRYHCLNDTSTENGKQPQKKKCQIWVITLNR